MQVDPLLVLIMAGLGYIAYGFLSPTLNPFAKSRRGARRRHIRFAQVVGVCLALSWVITLFFPMSVLLANLPTRIGMSLLAALVPISLLCVMVLLSSWRESRRAASRVGESERLDQLDIDLDGQADAPGSSVDANHYGHADASGSSDDAELDMAPATLHAQPDVALEPHTVDDLDVSAIELEADHDTSELILTEDGRRSAEQDEQMGRVSRLVDSYDLDTGPEDDLDATSMIHDTSRDLDEESVGQPPRHEVTDPVETAHALATVPSSSDKALQLAELATSNVKLKKLVIAQQAAIDSERKSHDRTRAIAKRAVQVAREAIDGRKSAEKMARREAAERQRATLKAREASAALRNALSMMAKQQRERTSEES